jgi:hypothetical protein
MAASLSLTPTPSIRHRHGGVDPHRGRRTLDSGVSLSYQWKRAGTNISGATSSTYKIVQADGGSAITVAVTGDEGRVMRCNGRPQAT